MTLSSLNNGQANIVIMVLFLVAAAAASQSRWFTCAFCAAFAVYWKIYPIAFALLLAVVFPKKLTFRILLVLIGLFVISLFLQKSSYALQQYGDWLVNLASDRRRAHEYYGRWRDFYLLLRLLGIPISTMWWTVVEVTAGAVAAAICILGTIRHWPRATLLLGAMSLAIVWMLLFGPATEAATYALIAVPSAYLLIAGWSEVSQSTLRVVSTLTYLGFVARIFSIPGSRSKKTFTSSMRFNLASLFVFARRSFFGGSISCLTKDTSLAAPARDRGHRAKFLCPP